jgi:ribonuclease P protein component
VTVIQKNKTFRTVYEKGKSRATKFLVMYRLPREGDTVRIGVSVSKRVGGAVLRNKIRRRVKEAFRLREKSVAARIRAVAGADVVFVARPAAGQACYAEIAESVDFLLGKFGL